jgi:hypothetical protein
MVVLSYLRAECCRKWDHLQPQEEERNAYMLFIALVSAIRDQWQMSFILVRIYLWFWQIVISHLCLNFNFTVQSLICQNNMQQDRQCRCLKHDQIFKKCGVCCMPFSLSAFSHMATNRNLTGQDCMVTILESNSDAHSSQDERHFSSQWHITQWAIQTANLLYTTTERVKTKRHSTSLNTTALTFDILLTVYHYVSQ